MKVMGEFLSLDKFDLGDGPQVRFWEDTWLSSHPINLIFPALYNIARNKKCLCKNSVIHNTVKCSLHEVPSRD